MNCCKPRITQIAEAALSAPDIADLLKMIHKNVNTLMPARNFYVVFYDERTDMMTFHIYADAYDFHPFLRENLSQTSQATYCEQAVQY